VQDYTECLWIKENAIGMRRGGIIEEQQKFTGARFPEKEGANRSSRTYGRD